MCSGMYPFLCYYNVFKSFWIFCTYWKAIFFSFQSKLNCEVLYDDLAFEVRWAVAGDSIVLQLVAKVGKSVLQYVCVGCLSNNTANPFYEETKSGQLFAKLYYLYRMSTLKLLLQVFWKVDNLETWNFARMPYA